MAKPRPGVCGTCGRAVVHAKGVVIDGTANGHTYRLSRLVKVRCNMHDAIRLAYENDMYKRYGADWRSMPVPSQERWSHDV